MQHGGVPELLLGLAYNGTTGRLAVELVKGSHFRNLAMTRAPDTYVRLRLASSSGQEIARAKSSLRRGQPNPLFKETFIFQVSGYGAAECQPRAAPTTCRKVPQRSNALSPQVALFQLPDVSLLVSVYNKRSMKKKETIGWFALGANSSGEEEAAHWNDMCDVRGEQICRWHVLLDC